MTEKPTSTSDAVARSIAAMRAGAPHMDELERFAQRVDAIVNATPIDADELTQALMVLFDLRADPKFHFPTPVRDPAAFQRRVEALIQLVQGAVLEHAPREVAKLFVDRAFSAYWEVIPKSFVDALGAASGMSADRLQTPLRSSLEEDPQVVDALQRLRSRLNQTTEANAYWRAKGWLDDGQAHGYLWAPPAQNAVDHIARFEQRYCPVPAAVQTLYAHLDWLWTGAGRPGSEPTTNEYLLFTSPDAVFDPYIGGERFERGQLILNALPEVGSWAIYNFEDGSVLSPKSPDGMRKIADSLPDYIDQLADTFGHPFGGSA